MQTGVKQGCVLSPTLFALFVAAMLNEMKKHWKCKPSAGMQFECN